jgi:hypothetical protein
MILIYATSFDWQHICTWSIIKALQLIRKRPQKHTSNLKNKSSIKSSSSAESR